MARTPKRKLDFALYSPTRSRVTGTYSSAKKMRSDAAAISSLQSQVATVKRKVAVDTSTIYYNIRQDFTASSAGGNAANVLNLTQYVNWGRTFGTDADDETGKQARLKAIMLDYTIKANAENDNMEASVIVFRLKDEASTDINASGNFISSSWPVQDGDMAYNPVTALSERQGIAGGWLNPKKYQVLHQKRFTLNPSFNTKVAGVAPASAFTTIATGANQGRHRQILSFGKAGLLMKAAAGDWKSSLRPLNTRNNVFIAVLTNDFSGDTAFPTFHLNAVCKVEV